MAKQIERTVGWQYVTQYYQDKRGRTRKHRKRIYNLCECGNIKVISSHKCRQCYERKKTKEEKKIELLKSCKTVLNELINQIDIGEIEDELLERSREKAREMEELLEE